MATRLRYTTGARSAELDEVFEAALASAREAWPGIQSFCGWKSSGLTGKGGLGPCYVQQFARGQSCTIVEQ